MPELEHLHGPGPENAKLIRRLQLSRDLIWIFMGLAAILASVQFYIDPDSIARSSVGKTLNSWVDDAWNISWGIGGLLIMAGVVRQKGRTEMIGQLFFLAGVIPNAVAILIVVGGGPSFWTVAVAGFANVGRIYYLWHTTPRRRKSL